MWTSTLELDAAHVLPVQILGRFWRGAYFSSFAPLQVRNVPRQSLPTARWVRVRNILAGICGSDLHLVFANGDFRVAPAALPTHGIIYPGHEVLGEVIEVGDEVQHVRVGDRVALQHNPNCITADIHPLCRSCAAGNYDMCEHGKLPGPRPIGGGWSEEMLLHEQQVFRVPSDLNDEQAVLLEPTAVALRSVLRRLPEPGERVLVIGAGSIGLLIVQMLRTLAPEAEISVVARHAFQVEQATRMGAAHILYPQDSYQGVQRITGGELYRGSFGNRMLLGGFDVIFDTIGTQRTVHDALRWTRAGGTVVLTGLNLHSMRVDLTPIWYQQVNLIGSVANGSETWPIGSSQRRQTFDIVAELMQQGIIHPEQLITHRFALTSYRDALHAATHRGQSRALKVVFDYALMPPSVVPNVRASRPRRQPAQTAQIAQPDSTAPVAQPAVPEISGSSAEEENVDERTVVFVRPPRTPYSSRTPEPIVMPSIPPTPLAPVLSDMVPPPLLEDDEASNTVVVSQATQAAQPLIAHSADETPSPTSADATIAETAQASQVSEVSQNAENADEEATKTVVVPGARRSRKRKTTTGTIATAPVEQTESGQSEPVTAASSSSNAPSVPDDAAPPPTWLDMNVPNTSIPSDTLHMPETADIAQEHQLQSDDMPDIPQWLSSLHIMGEESATPLDTPSSQSEQPDVEEMQPSVTNEVAGALQSVEEPSPPEDENNTHS